MPGTSSSINDFLSDLWSGMEPAGPPSPAGSVDPVRRAVAAPATGSAGHSGSTAALPFHPQGSEAFTESLFVPPSPRSLKEAGVSADELSRLLLKLLAARGALTGRRMALHLKLLFPLIEEVLSELRREQIIALKGEAVAGDYTYIPTEKGLAIARELARECTYFGAAPVTLGQYASAIKTQSVADQHIRMSGLRRAFADLLLSDELLRVLGPAINSGRGMFLFGEPGNGKTSIAERISRAFATTIWIPRAISIDGLIIRVFDPSIHQLAPPELSGVTRLDPSSVDQRWVCIMRPTVVAGGELTMNELEVTQDETTHICEAPLQLKSNGGVLLIDDFGRQRMPVDELLNRWIVPLEKRYDLLNLPNGKKAQVPFDQLVIFSTNLEPRDLVDDAFLRRIPYKVQVPNPSPEQFHQLFQIMCRSMNCEYRAEVVDYLIERHYRQTGRNLRACHPRDLLSQLRNYCLFEDQPMTMTREGIDFAVRCYFSVLS